MLIQQNHFWEDLKAAILGSSYVSAR